MKESWVTTSEISWPNIIQKIEIEIELMIWFYENIQKKFSKISHRVTVCFCVKISVWKKETFFTVENKISEKYKNLMLVFPFHLKLLSILENITVNFQV